LNELVKREQQQEIADLRHALEALKAFSAVKAAAWSDRRRSRQYLHWH
jgi:hypothetical protein